MLYTYETFEHSKVPINELVILLPLSVAVEAGVEEEEEDEEETHHVPSRHLHT